MSKRILPKAYAALLLYLGSLPLFLLPAAALLPGSLWLAAAMPAFAIALTGCAGLLDAKRRTAALLLAILSVAAVCAALALTRSPLWAVLFLPCLLVMLVFMPAMAQPAFQEWTAPRLGFGVLLHTAAQFSKGTDFFATAAAPLSWCFAAYLVLCLFTLNRGVLAGSASSASKALLTHNRRMLAVLCCAALLLANLKAVGTAVRAALWWIIASAARAAVWLINLLRPQSAPSAAGQGGNPLEGLTGGTEPVSAFAKIMETVLTVLAALIAAALVFFALRYLYGLLKKALLRFSERWQAYRRKISADYMDQNESLLDWGELRKAAAARADRFRRRYFPVPWERLSPQQRVRRVYSLLLRRPVTQNPALTARETLLGGALNLPAEDAAALAALYERARYSDHPVTEDEADAARRHAGV